MEKLPFDIILKSKLQQRFTTVFESALKCKAVCFKNSSQLTHVQPFSYVFTGKIFRNVNIWQDGILSLPEMRVLLASLISINSILESVVLVYVNYTQYQSKLIHTKILSSLLVYF